MVEYSVVCYYLKKSLNYILIVGGIRVDHLAVTTIISRYESIEASGTCVLLCETIDIEASIDN